VPDSTHLLPASMLSASSVLLSLSSLHTSSRADARLSLSSWIATTNRLSGSESHPVAGTLKVRRHRGHFGDASGTSLRQSESRHAQQNVCEHGRHLAFDSSLLHWEHFVIVKTSTPSIPASRKARLSNSTQLNDHP